ncbi:DUF2000 domain-containing protein [Micromonospora sp. NPDC049282]|uniref:DUF2000 domain-containing protein n=1 Tax=Micromonospora sp. NPDC049282 TaxID=3364269 RepID=UPI003712CE2E
MSSTETSNPTADSQEAGIRTVIVLNRKLDVGRLLNVAGHLAVGLAAGAPDHRLFDLQTYRDADGDTHPDISAHPVIILKADNSNRIARLRVELSEAGVRSVDFVNTMADGGTARQLLDTAATAAADLEYYGIAFIGERAILDPLTKRFSLFK